MGEYPNHLIDHVAVAAQMSSADNPCVEAAIIILFGIFLQRNDFLSEDLLSSDDGNGCMTSAGTQPSRGRFRRNVRRSNPTWT